MQKILQDHIRTIEKASLFEAEQIFSVIKKLTSAREQGFTAEIENIISEFKVNCPDELPQPTTANNLKEFLSWTYTKSVEGKLSNDRVAEMMQISEAVLKGLQTILIDKN